MDQTRWKAFNPKHTDICFFTCIVGVFLLQIFLLFTPIREEYIGSTYLAPLIVAMVLYLFMRIGLPRTPVVLLPPGFALWHLLTRILNGDTYLYWSHSYVYMVILSCCVLFLAPFLANAEQRDKFLKAVALAYCLAFSAIAWTAVIASLTGNPWVDPLDVTRIIGINERFSNPYRLNVLYIHPNISAAFFYTALALLFYLFFRTKKIWLRIGYGILGAGLCMAIFLTGSISAIIVTGLMFGLVAFAMIAAGKKINKRRIILAILAILIVAVIVVISYPVILQWAKGFTTDVQQQETMQETVTDEQNQESAETEDVVFVQDRLKAKNIIGTMQARFLIYSSAFLSIADRPVTLLIGELYQDAMDRAANVINHTNFYHLHNTYLQTLVVGGGISLLLALLFTVLLIMHAVRLFFNPCVPLYHKMLVLAPVGLLCHSMTEPLLFIDTRLPNMLFFLLAGMIIAYSKEAAASSKATHTAEPVSEVKTADVL